MSNNRKEKQVRIAIQTRKQQEKEWEQAHRGGIMSGVGPLFSQIAALKDHKIKPEIRKELEDVLEKTLKFWQLMDWAIYQYETWPDEHLPDFLIAWRNNNA